MSLASTIMNYLQLQNLFFPIYYASLFFESHTFQQHLAKYLVSFLFNIIFQMQLTFNMNTTTWVLHINDPMTSLSYHTSLSFKCYDTCISIICNMQYLNLCYINKQFFNVLLLFILLLALCFSCKINEYLLYGQFSPVVC